MPWPNRLLSGSSVPIIRLSTPVSEDLQAPHTRIPGTDAYEGSADIRGVPLLQTTPSPRPAVGVQQRRRGNHHGRSFSNPFPSLFGGKKVNKGVGVDIIDTGLEALDDRVFEDRQEDALAEESTLGIGELVTHRKSDSATGKCMTCGLTVKWAEHLEVFRCTVCLTINDLKSPFQRITPPNGCRSESQFGSGRTSMDCAGKKGTLMSSAFQGRI